jgi:biotin-dependent carboxylase-like uncharacterized protein
VLEVVEPGLLATIQDAGRPGFQHLGVAVAGACDGWSLAVANLLLGDRPDRAAVEVTLGGTVLVAREACVIGLGGADLGAEIDGHPVRPGIAHRLDRGAHLRFTGGRSGARAYVALPGGVDAPTVLGSASTDVRAGLGGLGGRALAAGDRLAPRRPGDLAAAGRRWPGPDAGPSMDPSEPIALLPGPDLRRLPSDALDAIASTGWTVAPDADRMGVRLLGGSPLTVGSIVSQPVVPGSVQLTETGMPIVLLADAQTVGGYPVVAIVARADLPRVGQLRPGARVRFSVLTTDEARRRWRLQGRRLAQAAGRIGAEATWDGLAGEARG